MSEKFNLQADKAVKNPVSLRVESYDENPYYNPNPIPFQNTMETDKKSGHVIRNVAEKTKFVIMLKKPFRLFKKNESISRNNIRIGLNRVCISSRFWRRGTILVSPDQPCK